MNNIIRPLFVPVFLLVGLWLALVSNSIAATITVNSLADAQANNGQCTLREAIINANVNNQTGSTDCTAGSGNDVIQFSVNGTINLTAALPNLTGNLTIFGPGARLLTIQRGTGGNYRIFDIPSAGLTIEFYQLTISNGNVGGNDFGGGIRSSSNLTLSNVHVTGNTAGGGGGGVALSANGDFTNCTFSNNLVTAGTSIGGGAIFFQSDNGRTLLLTQSTISGNRNAGRAGGIQHYNLSNSGTLTITNSTIANNVAGNNGGGVETTAIFASSAPTTTLSSTIIANNTPNNLTKFQQNGGTATVNSNGRNLSNNFNGAFTSPGPLDQTADPRLAPLAFYGGQMPTHALLSGSPAFDNGNSSGLINDQRGVNREYPLAGTADIGAVEMQRNLVTNDNDNGPGSLRDAIAEALANGATTLDDIIFEDVFFNQPRTIFLTTDELFINSNLNIIAPGYNLLGVSGNNAFRVFQIGPAFTVTLCGMSIFSGNAGGDGGGIYNDGTLTVTHSLVQLNSSAFNGGGIGNGSNDSLTVSHSTISGNTAAGAGGGIYNFGTANVSNSTISGNNGSQGGGIYNSNTLSVTNSTITANTVDATEGGGIETFGTISTIRNSIVAANVNNLTKPDVTGTGFTSNGFNLIGNIGSVTAFNQTGDQVGANIPALGVTPLNPMLGPLTGNGSILPTHALLAGSPALDKGDRSGATTDQRGLVRPLDKAGHSNASDGSDVGAFEDQTTPNNLPTASPQTVNNVITAGPASYFFTISYADEVAINVSTINAGDVTVTGPNGFSVTPTVFNVPNNTNGTPRTAEYRFTPPGGTWDLADNGTYNIVMQANQVADTDGSFIAAGQLASFTVNIANCTYLFNPGHTGAFPAPGGTYNFTITTQTGCAWTLTSQVSWLTFSSPGGISSAVVPYTVAANSGVARTGTITIDGLVTTVNQNGATVKSDFDGDRKTDVSVWRPATGVWWIYNSSNNTHTARQWGFSTDIPVAGDYDGDGKTDTAIWRPSDGTWWIFQSSTNTFRTQQWGFSTDKPVPADYDGDGKTDVAIWRPSDGTWWIFQSSTNTFTTRQWGFSSDVPVPGDYDGDGKADVAIWRPSDGTWWIFRSSTNTFTMRQWGFSSDKPLPRDYDGDGKTDIAVWRPSDGTWWIFNSSSQTLSYRQWGFSSDLPTPGDYDSDGKADVAIFRPSDGTWWIFQSATNTFRTQQWGFNGDIPVPSR